MQKKTSEVAIMRIPTYIFTGFLGGGKTTLLKNVLVEVQASGLTPGVILNELATVNVEEGQFEGISMEQILGGCVCCTLRDSMQDSLRTLAELELDQSIDVLFIEGTGVANPLELKKALDLEDRFELEGIIGLVDASDYLDYHSVIWSAKDDRELMQQQIASADVVVLNKIDLVKPKKLEKIEQRLRESVLPHIPIVSTSRAKVSFDQLTTLMAKEKGSKPSFPTSTVAHHKKMKAKTFEDVPPFSTLELEQWFQQLPAGIVRGKGVIAAKDGRKYTIQYASSQLEMQVTLSDKEPVLVLIGGEEALSQVSFSK